MKKIVIILISIILFIFLFGIIYFHLPFKIKYRTEIKFGNQLVEKIEIFRLKNDSIPLTEDRKILHSLGFENTENFLPIYQKINAKDYLLVYCWGFDPPWLFYYSKTKKWEYGSNYPFPEEKS